jgi:hypothetical protein
LWKGWSCGSHSNCLAAPGGFRENVCVALSSTAGLVQVSHTYHTGPFSFLRRSPSSCEHCDFQPLTDLRRCLTPFTLRGSDSSTLITAFSHSCSASPNAFLFSFIVCIFKQLKHILKTSEVISIIFFEIHYASMSIIRNQISLLTTLKK